MVDCEALNALRKERDELEAQRDDWKKEAHNLGGHIRDLQKVIIEGTRKNADLESAAQELVDAIRELYDCQNGPPLLGNREQEWNEAMVVAEELLRCFSAWKNKHMPTDKEM